MKRYVDLAACAAALCWAITSIYLPAIAKLCSPEVAFGFALVAGGRALQELKA